jgi:hypothetical protein
VYLSANKLVNGFVYKSANGIKRDSRRVLKDIHDFLIERHKKEPDLHSTWACLFDFKSTDTTIVTTTFNNNLEEALKHADGLMVFGENGGERSMSHVKTENQRELSLWFQYKQIKSEQKTFIIYFRLSNETQILKLCKSMSFETCTCNTLKARLRCSTVDLDKLRTLRMMALPKAKPTAKPKPKPKAKQSSRSRHSRR